jgi:hypothetical protein
MCQLHDADGCGPTLPMLTFTSPGPRLPEPHSLLLTVHSSQISLEESSSVGSNTRGGDAHVGDSRDIGWPQWQVSILSMWYHSCMQPRQGTFLLYNWGFLDFGCFHRSLWVRIILVCFFSGWPGIDQLHAIHGLDRHTAIFPLGLLMRMTIRSST